MTLKLWRLQRVLISQY